MKMSGSVPENFWLRRARRRFTDIITQRKYDSDLFDNYDCCDPNPNQDLQGYPSTSKRSHHHLDLNLDSTFTEPKKNLLIFKLFERGVDLSQFQESTGLYPIARQWLRNKPYEQLKQTQEYEDERMENGTGTGLPGVLQLPPPRPLPIDLNGHRIDIRIPPPLAKPEDEMSVEMALTMSDEEPNPAVLFTNHLERWHLVRQNWKAAAAQNESRYEASLGIIGQIYDSGSGNATH